MMKDKFLECLGLVSVEQLKAKPEVKRVERRRRTTANPKYNTNGFVELRQVKRSRRFEEVETKHSTPKRANLVATVMPKEILLPKCYVCEQTDTELTCESCHSQYHPDCIRVTGSKAPTPTRLPNCPNCISARLESQKLLLLSKASDTSATSSSSSAKFQSSLLTSSSLIPLDVQKNSTSCRVNQSLDYNISKSSTKSKIVKKSTAGTPIGTNKSSMQTKKGAYVTQTDSTEICKPVLTSPFKSLTALTSKGAAAKNLQGGSRLSNGETVINGVPGSKSIKKKSKLNGVKAKTLSVTGKSTPSPLNNLNSNGNINNLKSQSNYTSSRLQSFADLTTDQPLLMQRTILAMTAAAKSVMSSNGMRVVSPVSVGDLKGSSSISSGSTTFTDKERYL